ncbi:MAG TPA: hypothetical protein VMB81_17830, partial [Candidatus Sulfotelmatobacter sp.]|nr:hypothetical protein [Candidatus Sulfotelmatobacter sp.]
EPRHAKTVATVDAPDAQRVGNLTDEMQVRLTGLGLAQLVGGIERFDSGTVSVKNDDIGRDERVEQARPPHEVERGLASVTDPDGHHMPPVDVSFDRLRGLNVADQSLGLSLGRQSDADAFTVLPD